MKRNKDPKKAPKPAGPSASKHKGSSTHKQQKSKGSKAKLTEQAKPVFKLTVDEMFERITSAMYLDLAPHASPDSMYEKYAPEEALSLFSRRQIDDFAKRYIPQTAKEKEIRRHTDKVFVGNEKRLRSLIPAITDRLSLALERDMCYTSFPTINRWGESDLKWKDVRQFKHVTEPSLGGIPLYRILRRARAIIADAMGEPPSVGDVLQRMRFGDGTTLGVPYADTSATRKLRFPITATGRAAEWFSRYATKDPLFVDAVQSVNFPTDIGPPRVFLISPGIKRSLVPKTAKIMRGIAPPCTLNSCGQQAIAHEQTARLRAIGLDIEQLAAIHCKKAEYASVTRSDATWDGTSASDNWITPVVQFLYGLAPGWFWWMDLFRADLTYIRGSWVRLSTFTQMGDATCFPNETTLFWALAVATEQEFDPASRELEGPNRLLYSSCSAYGDDVFLPSRSCNMFMEVMTALGQVTNVEKTHWEPHDPFRESCGFDAFAGVEIRPYSPRTPEHAESMLGRQAWVYSVMNQLFKRCIPHFGVDFVLNSNMLRAFADIALIEGWRIAVIPDHFPADAGLWYIGHSPLDDGGNTSVALPTIGCINQVLFKMKVDLIPEGYDKHLQQRTFSIIRWMVKATADEIDEVRLWNTKTRYSDYGPLEFGDYTYTDTVRYHWVPFVRPWRTVTRVWVRNDPDVRPRRTSTYGTFFNLWRSLKPTIEQCDATLQGWWRKYFFGGLTPFNDCELKGSVIVIKPGRYCPIPEGERARCASDELLLITRREYRERRRSYPSFDWLQASKNMRSYLKRDWSVCKYKIVPGPVAPRYVLDRQKGYYTASVATHL